MALFYGWGSTASRLEPLQGDKHKICLDTFFEFFDHNMGNQFLIYMTNTLYKKYSNTETVRFIAYLSGELPHYLYFIIS